MESPGKIGNFIGLEAPMEKCFSNSPQTKAYYKAMVMVANCLKMNSMFAAGANMTVTKKCVLAPCELDSLKGRRNTKLSTN